MEPGKGYLNIYNVLKVSYPALTSITMRVSDMYTFNIPDRGVKTIFAMGVLCSLYLLTRTVAYPLRRLLTWLRSVGNANCPTNALPAVVKIT